MSEILSDADFADDVLTDADFAAFAVRWIGAEGRRVRMASFVFSGGLVR